MPSTSRLGIATRLLALVALTLTPVFAILLLAAEADRRTAVEEARDALSREARAVMASYVTRVRETEKVLHTLAQVPSFRRVENSACQLLTDVTRADTTYVSLALAKPDGTFACQTVTGRPQAGSPPGINVLDRPWFQVPMATGQPAVQVLRAGRVSGVPTLVVGIPVRSEGRVVAVLGGGVPLANLDEVLRDAAIPTDRGVVVIGAGVPLVSRGNLPLEMLTPEGDAFVARSDSDQVVRLETSETSFITAFANSQLIPSLAVAIGTSEDALLAPLNQRLRSQIVALALLGLVALVTAWLLALRWVANPLARVASTADAVGRGHLDERVPDTAGPEEVRTLAAAFNAMAASLEERERALRETHAALKESNERLAQAQKLEALGHLTGGIAHDFNNLLTVIAGNLELALEDDPNPAVQPLLNEALNAAQSGAETTRRLLAFARKQPLSVTRLDLNELCRSAGGLLGRNLGEHLDIRFRLTEAPLLCEVDRSQLMSVVLNLAVNARDAMPDGGNLTIRTDTVRLTGRDDVPTGRYALLEVTDTGTGMPPAVAARALEPFFTTKERGQGTGLGLSGALGFAQQSGGTLEVETREGVGTTVRVYLPLARESSSVPAQTVVA